MKGFIFFLLFTYINVAHADGDLKESKCNFFGLQAEMIMESPKQEKGL